MRKQPSLLLLPLFLGPLREHFALLQISHRHLTLLLLWPLPLPRRLFSSHPFLRSNRQPTTWTWTPRSARSDCEIDNRPSKIKSRRHNFSRPPPRHLRAKSMQLSRWPISPLRSAVSAHLCATCSRRASNQAIFASPSSSSSRSSSHPCCLCSPSALSTT